MENKIVTLEINSNLDLTEKAIGTLKQQLKAAKAEVLALSDEFGITSQQAIRAAEKAAALGHEISAANKLVKIFNPSATLNSTTQALGSVREGFEAAGSTMKLFGTESTQVEDAIKKVGVAMDVTSGITSIQESVNAYKNLGATLKSFAIVQRIITAAQYVWNAALMANPIGAIIVAITALIAAGYALTKYFMANAEASEKNAKAIKSDTKALEEQVKTADKNSEALDINSKQKLAMAKASGKSAEEIRKLELKLADEKIAFEKSSREIAKNTYYKNENILATLKASGASEEEIKSREEVTKASLKAFEKENKDLTAAVKEKAAIINRHQVEVRTGETKHNDELKEKQKTAREKAAEVLEAQQKKDAEDLKNALQAQKTAQENNAAEITKAIGDAEDKQAEKTMTASEIEQRVVKDKYFSLIQLAKQQNRTKEEVDVLETQRLDELNKIKDKYRLEDDAKKAADLEKTINDNQVSFDNRLAAIDTEQALYQKQFDDKLISEKDFNEKTKALTESRIKIGDLETKAKMENMQRGSALLSNIGDLIGKNTAVGKTAAIAAATIDTYAAAQSAFKNAQLNPISILGPAYPYISAGLAIAGGLKNVQSILAVKTPGAGGGSVPSGGGMTGSAAPAFNVVGASSSNQLAQTISTQQQQPIQAYVVASNVTTAQALNRNIIQSASIG